MTAMLQLLLLMIAVPFAAPDTAYAEDQTFAAPYDYRGDSGYSMEDRDQLNTLANVYERKDKKLQGDVRQGWCQVQGKWKC
jgi:hypothetical protein